MKQRVRLLRLVVSFTLVLLTMGATLAVLGIFNEALAWDIFGPKLEALLHGVFGACMALAGFGAVMSVIIAMQDSVRNFQKLVQSQTNEPARAEATRGGYAGRMLLIALGTTVLVAACAGVNHLVLRHRCKVFKRLAEEHVTNFEKQIVTHVGGFQTPPQDNVPREVYDVLKAIDNLEFINRITLYIPDPVEANAMWGFTAWRSFYTNADGFAKFYIAKDFEKAMRSAVDGDMTSLSEINERNSFAWYRLLETQADTPRAIVRIDGNSYANLREYRLGM